jgi:ribosomal protein S18 acetylase RimI-like enzyme
MAEKVTTRQCLTDDIDTVLEIWRLAGSTPSITDTPQDLQMVINPGASNVILAVSGNAVAGSIIAAFDGWRANICRLAVHPDHQRKGIARRLFLESETWLRYQGARRIGAVVEQDHLWAIGFWESAGFALEPLALRYTKNL